MHYTYDDLGQLIKESPGFGGYIYNYTYDNAGNITKIQVSSTNSVLYPATYVKNFEYSDSAWGDLLVAVNNSSIAYDNIGNPTTYYNGFTFTWEGRRLVGATKGADTYSFTYNEDGLRTSKTKNGVTTNYYYSDLLLVKEESSTQTIVYLYDANGSPVGFKYRTPSYAEDVWDEYFYEKNLQGDIVAVYTAAGAKLISYTYDAWGNFTTSYHNGGASTTAAKNPITYRGYYYDSDIGFYYLQSRYYDPATCRFINADGYVSTGQGILGYNMFAYCNNNPISYLDYHGTSPMALIAFLLIGAGVIIVLTSCSNSDIDSVEKVEDSIEYDEKNGKIDVFISVDNIPDSDDFLIDYTDRLADKIENSEEGKEILGENKIDRTQLYSEIKFHAEAWDFHFMRGNANPAHIRIYANGQVIDDRDYLNDFVFWAYGDEYYGGIND